MTQCTGKKDLFEEQALPQLEDIYHTASYMLDDQFAVRDLVRASFVKAYRLWYDCSNNANCRVWLFKSMTNILRNKYWSYPGFVITPNGHGKTAGYQAYSQWALRYESDKPYQAFFSRISEDKVKQAIKSLPRDIRLLVVLSLLEEFSYQEIVEIADIKLETVKSGLFQGRKLIQKELFGHMLNEHNFVKLMGRVRS